MNRVIKWLKSLFKHQSEASFDRESKEIEKTNKIIQKAGTYISSQLISFSNASYTCAEAARICIGKHADSDYDKRLSYIEKVVKRGHESTIAHSNIVMMIIFDKAYESSYCECSNAFKFLNISNRMHNNRHYLLIGGSIRAYKYFIRQVRDVNNPFFQQIINTLYGAAEKEFFTDLIEDDIMVESKFGFTPLAGLKGVYEHKYDKDGTPYDEEVAEDTGVYIQKPSIGKQVDIIHADDPYMIYDIVSSYGFDIEDVLRITACSIIFHDFSRSTSQQITRHFAGISQESQRYVNYSESPFVDPIPFNYIQGISNPYDTNMIKDYSIELFGTKVSRSSKALGEELVTVYKQLLDQGMNKQDARAFLPFNVTTKVMMTFTYADLIHFINMRDNKAAQPEIQVMTKELESLLEDNASTKTMFGFYGIKSLIDKVESPRYKSDASINPKEVEVDEVISETVEYENKK